MATKETEERPTGALAMTTAELETLKAEFSAVKEAQEKGGEAVVAVKKELEELEAEIAVTKESEMKLKGAVGDYRLKLQGSRTDLEDATKIAENVLSSIN